MHVHLGYNMSLQPRQKAMGPKMERLGSVTFGGGGTGGVGETPNLEEKQPKVKPMSKRLAGSISQCSSKMTEILSWESKVQDNKSGMSLD